MDNSERVRKAMDDWNEGCLQALSDGWWADDIVWHDLPELPDAVDSIGLAAANARVQEMVDAAGHWRFEVKAVEEHDDVTLSELEILGSGAQSGAAFTGTIYQLNRWRDGRVVEVHSFSNRAEAVETMLRLSSAR